MVGRIEVSGSKAEWAGAWIKRGAQFDEITCPYCTGVFQFVESGGKVGQVTQVTCPWCRNVILVMAVVV